MYGRTRFTFFWATAGVLLLLGAAIDIVRAQTPLPTPDISKPNYTNTPPLRKFVDTLPGLTAAAANNLGQYLPLATPDKHTYPGSDYYEIGLIDHRERMHSDLPATGTQVRGYYQINNGKDEIGNEITSDKSPRYLGPIIAATKDRPVRFKFINKLPAGSEKVHANSPTPRPGDLFLPVDMTVNGAGPGPLDISPTGREFFAQNRATIHLHGGFVPWISDGTPHQWTAPAGDATSYKKGVSVYDVPDMPTQEGEITFYYPNAQSGRLMMYHDHASGLTRLNAYAGEASGYLLMDPAERGLTPAGTFDIPLIIQDKTFVPNDATLAATDPLWLEGRARFGWGGEGDLWFPSVYTPNQDPYLVNPNTDPIDGMNPVGRWDYGPWIWPPVVSVNPELPWPSEVMEAFMDTPVVNGTAYPVLKVEPRDYRFRILSVGNDRGFNLQLYRAKSSGAMWNADGTLADADAGEIPMVPADGKTYTLTPPGVTPVKTYSVESDGRAAGVPDPRAAGPAMILMGTEGGLLKKHVKLNAPPDPISFDRDPKSMTVGNVDGGTLMLGPAERADVVIDFSQFAGQTLILYNDAPAAWPAGDPRYDYYTGNPDFTFNGGTVPTLPGYGPNTRTVMQIQVGTVGNAPAPVQSITLLERGRYYSNPTVTLTDGVHTDSARATTFFGEISAITYKGTVQFTTAPKVIIADTAPGIGSGATAIATLTPGTAYDEAGLIAKFNTVAAAVYAAEPLPIPEGKYARIFDTQMVVNGQTIPFRSKAIVEEFDMFHGRMNAMLGTEWWIINNQGQQTNGFQYIDPTTETVADGETQIWKIVHNGVDTHLIHFHLVNVQVINRTDWAGVIKPPEPDELGWKETVKMNPLEDCFVAVRAAKPPLPTTWPELPDSIRPLNPAEPLGALIGFTNPFPDPNNPAGTTTVNRMMNFGWEYVWHCHLLAHEEFDMMRPMLLQVAHLAPPAPELVSAIVAGTPVTPTVPWQGPPLQIVLKLRDNSVTELGFRIERATVDGNGVVGTFAAVGTADPFPGTGAELTFIDTTAAANTRYAYQVVAVASNPPGTIPSEPSNILQVTTPVIPVAPNQPALQRSALSVNPPTVTFNWSDRSNNETGFRIQRARNSTFTQGLTPFYVGPNTTSFIDVTVGLNTLYYYRVAAFNPSGFSANTAARSVVTVGQLPAAPTGLSVGNAAIDSLTISWTASPPTNGVPVISYQLQRQNPNNGNWINVPGAATILAPTTSFLHTGLARGTTYTYRVRASNAFGDSAWSATAQGSTLP